MTSTRCDRGIPFLSLLFGICLLEFAAASATAAEKKLLLLGQRPDGHPPGTHEYMAGQRVVQHLLRDVPGLKTEIVQADDAWSEGPELIAKADGVVLFVSEGAKWVSADPRRHEAFAKLAQRKGGLTVFHWAMGAKDATNIEPFARLFGGCHGGPDRKYTFYEKIEVTFAADHPVTAGLKPLTLGEEFYYHVKQAPRDAGRITPLATIPTADSTQMVGWAFDRTDGGRSFGFTGLHFHKNWSREEYRRLITQAVLWTMNIAPPAEMKLDVPTELIELEAVK
jgi:type 1 glutamine amidotransferase